MGLSYENLRALNKNTPVIVLDNTGTREKGLLLYCRTDRLSIGYLLSKKGCACMLGLDKKIESGGRLWRCLKLTLHISSS